MYTNALGVALFIQFVNNINRWKCEGLAKTNRAFLVRLDQERMTLRAMSKRVEVLKHELYYQALYSEALGMDLDRLNKEKGNT